MNSKEIFENSEDYPVINICEMCEFLKNKFEGKPVTIQYNSAVNFYMDVEDFNVAEVTIKDGGDKRLFLNDGDKDLLFIEKNDIVCVMDVFDNVSIYFKNDDLMQIYNEEGD